MLRYLSYILFVCILLCRKAQKVDTISPETSVSISGQKNKIVFPDMMGNTCEKPVVKINQQQEKNRLFFVKLYFGEDKKLFTYTS